MCGIFGFSHTTDITRRMTPHLAWEMEDRGHDSWGATDGDHTVRVLGPITGSFARYATEVGEWDRAIFHTRAASQGSVCLDNQHPFEFDEGGTRGAKGWVRTVVGIHNGIVSNHQSLNQQYGRGFAVDTMHIFKHLAEHRDTGEIQGYGNLAWYLYTPEAPEGVLHLCRFNNDALHIARLETGELVFASTKEPITRAALMAGTAVRQFVRTEEEQVYYVKFDVDSTIPTLFKSARKLPFGTRTTYQTCGMPGWVSDRRTSESIHSATGYLSGTCGIFSCNKKVAGNRKVSLVCEDCYRSILTGARSEGVHV